MNPSLTKFVDGLQYFQQQHFQVKKTAKMSHRTGQGKSAMGDIIQRIYTSILQPN